MHRISGVRIGRRPDCKPSWRLKSPSRVTMQKDASVRRFGFCVYIYSPSSLLISQDDVQKNHCAFLSHGSWKRFHICLLAHPPSLICMVAVVVLFASYFWYASLVAAASPSLLFARPTFMFPSSFACHPLCHLASIYLPLVAGTT